MLDYLAGCFLDFLNSKFTRNVVYLEKKLSTSHFQSSVLAAPIDQGVCTNQVPAFKWRNISVLTSLNETEIMESPAVCSSYPFLNSKFTRNVVYLEQKAFNFTIFNLTYTSGTY